MPTPFSFAHFMKILCRHCADRKCILPDFNECNNIFKGELIIFSITYKKARILFNHCKFIYMISLIKESTIF